MDYSVLKNEITNDPTKIGYAALLASGSDAGISPALNALTQARISRGIVSVSVFMADFGAQVLALKADPTLSVAPQFAALLWSLSIVSTIDYSNPVVLGGLAGMAKASVSGLTQDQITLITTRPASRADVLFGAGVIVSPADVAQAMKAGG